MANIIGTNGNDTLLGSDSADTINGKAGNDTITANQGNDTLTGGGGKDKFIYNYSYNYNDGTDTITDFNGVGKGTNPTAGVIAEVDTLKFLGGGFTARNLLLTENGNNLEITFEGVSDAKVILKNFKLEDLDNLKASSTRPAIGNILFDGQTNITDSFNVLDANSTETSIGIKNTVTFLNDLDNNITGLDNSDDVVNGQGGNDKIDGLSGNDLLRGGTGNDTLIGGTGNDTLVAGTRNNSLGGTGDNNSNINYSLGNNLLSGGDGNDFLFASGYSDYNDGFNIYYTYASGNNTLNGGAGDDTLNVDASTGNNLLNGGAGGNSLYAVGSTGDNLLNGGDGNSLLYIANSSGNNTLVGGAGNNDMVADYSTGNNLLYGGDSSNYFSIQHASGNNTLVGGAGGDVFLNWYSTGNNLLDGGTGNDLLNYRGSSGIGKITSSFNATTNIGSITAGTSVVSYKNIKQLEITGTEYDDYILGSNGNDTIDGGDGGNDTIDGGAGNDLLSYNFDYYPSEGITSTFNAITNIGSITIGTNVLNYKNIERLEITGTKYDDKIVGSNGNDTINGGTGNEGFEGTGGNDTISGGTGDDILGGTGGNNTINGGTGNDTINGGTGGNDTIDGGTGDDLLSYSVYATGGITTTINATTNIGSITAGTNVVSYKNIERLNISGTIYDDNIVGNNGNDTFSGGVTIGNDTIDGGTGDDLLSYDFDFLFPYNGTEGITSTYNATINIGSITAGTNQVSYKNIERLNISGTIYDDNIVGSKGNDTLNGGNAGNDTILGGAGNDILTGGNGNDTLYGNGGTDTFAFNNYNEGVDIIYDFNATNELIQVSANDFGGGLSPGSLSANQFTIGTSATTSAQRFIYDSTTGALFFDQDGSASRFTQVKFTQLLSGLSLTKNNFVVA
ncbi:MAG: calcium-binding protein [Nostoc sp.]